MILTGKQILENIGKSIKIEPFNESQVNPNSYNLRLHNKLLCYTESPLDMKKLNSYEELTIPEEGLVLEPGKLYLGRTVEKTYTDKYVPMLEGRSSVGRLGILIHATAGFGDVGFNGYWTLEISCIEPVRIYPDVEICQIYYHGIDGEYTPYMSGKYNNNDDIQPSLMYKDFSKNEPISTKCIDDKSVEATDISFMLGVERNKKEDINCPSYYTYGNIETVDFIMDKNLNFNLGNTIKYVVRAGRKREEGMSNSDKTIQDLKKAIRYLQFEVEHLEGRR